MRAPTWTACAARSAFSLGSPSARPETEGPRLTAWKAFPGRAVPRPSVQTGRATHGSQRGGLMNPTAQLQRATFSTSRFLEFCLKRSGRADRHPGEGMRRSTCSRSSWITRSTHVRRPARARSQRRGRRRQDRRDRQRSRHSRDTVKPSSISRSGCRARRHMSRRPGARRATLSRPSWPCRSCSRWRAFAVSVIEAHEVAHEIQFTGRSSPTDAQANPVTCSTYKLVRDRRPR